MLRPATPPLTSLCTQELKAFVIRRVRLRIRWDNGCKDIGYTTKGVVEVPGLFRFMLLPGGKFLLIIDNEGALTLRRIELKDGQVSIPIVATFEFNQGRLMQGVGRDKLLTTTSPSPIFVHNE